MDKNIFNQYKSKIFKAVDSRSLYEAFSLARSLAAALTDNKADATLRDTEDSYKLLLDYASRGADDPQRAEMVASMGEAILQQVDEMERRLLQPDTPSLYYNTLRYEQLQRNDNIPALLGQYREALGEGSLFDAIISGAHSENLSERLTRLEALETRLFNRLWVTHPLSNSDYEALFIVFTSGDYPQHFVEQMLAALLLGGLEYHDSRRIELAVDCYLNAPSGKLRTAAFITLVLLMFMKRRRNLPRRFRDKLARAQETEHWDSDMRIAFIELVKTIDTERITRKIRDEIVPEMMKLRPHINDKLHLDVEKFDLADLEENPEWMEMLDRSGISDKLREMSEIQEEGGDVMLGTFAHLKSFPFFNTTANWFLPFHTDHSMFTGDKGSQLRPIAEIIESAPFLCDSDKYSFLLSLAQAPENQRKLMLSQFEMQGQQLAALQAASLRGADADDRATINHQVQNFYRFFKLFRRKGEFRNPFDRSLNLSEVPLLRETIMRLDLLPVVGEFYFSHGYYAEALAIFRILEQADLTDSQLFQKMGFALEKTDRFAEATEYYLKSELLDERNLWTKRKLARAFMSLGKPELALPRLEQLTATQPDDVSLTLLYGRCLVELERYAEALKQFHKADYLDSKSGKAMRPIAWCLLMTGNFDGAQRQYEKIVMEMNPTQADYLNMGHVALAQRRFREALNLYSLNISSRGEKYPEPQRRNKAVEEFLNDMRADTPALRHAGVDTDLIPLLTDSLLYSL